MATEQMTDSERFWTHCVDRPGLWLVAVKDGAIDSWDGPHDTSQDVAKALRLFRSLGLDRSGRRYWMVRFDEVPDHPGEINEKAVGILRPMIDHYHSRKESDHG